MLDVCVCKKKCITLFDRSLRENIHSKYWELPYAKQRDWLFAKTTSKNPDCIRIKGDVRQRKRSLQRKLSPTIHYSLPNKGEDLKVCQRFFLSTLGYSSDSVIKALVAQLTPTKISPPVSIRGKHAPKHKLPQETKEEIRAHINMFNPAVSHYRRERAPQRKYLSPKLTVREMYNDFSQMSSGLIHYSTYQKIVHSMNISFAKLGEEECETCEKYKMHVHDSAREGNLPNVHMEKLRERGLPLPNEECNQCKT